MQTPINSDGLRRVVLLHLEKYHPGTRQEALDMLTASLGAYDIKGVTLACGVEEYFGNLKRL